MNVYGNSIIRTSINSKTAGNDYLISERIVCAAGTNPIGNRTVVGADKVCLVHLPMVIYNLYHHHAFINLYEERNKYNHQKRRAQQNLFQRFQLVFPFFRHFHHLSSRKISKQNPAQRILAG